MGITELAPAKLNLTLDVGARRPDGYHDITSIMQSAALYDVVALDFSEAGGIAIECPGTDLPTGPDNLAWKAADVFFQETNIPRTGISIRLEKKIPSQAGLGGGSSDAAAVLRGMRRLCHVDVSDESLEAMAPGWAVMFPTASGAVRLWPRAGANGLPFFRHCLCAGSLS